VIVGATNSKLALTTSDGSILDVSSGDVTVAGLEVGGTSVALSPNNGVTLTGGTLTLRHVTVDNCMNAGIKVSAGHLVLQQSTVATNLFGGVDIDGLGASFDISNNFIYRNGQTTSAVVGGIRVLQFSPSGNSKVEFNTIVDNHIAATATQAGGLFCLTMFPTKNNIVARNDVNGIRDATNSNQFGDCTALTSYLGPDAGPLNFLSPDSAPFNYRIQAPSAAMDQATSQTSIDYDVDGNHRPFGPQPDQGAFEVQ